jgi:hypothetical protein
LLSDFKKTVKIEPLITDVQRLEDIPSTVRMNLHPWLDIHPLSVKFWDWVCKKYKIQPHN